jgi:glutathione synthase/RimK-type ligase-like ATP-grasp enzyme
VAVIRTCAVTWLTEIDPLVAAENKLVQLAAAERLGIATPETIVTSEPRAVLQALGDNVVLKPLGSGHYYDGDAPFIIYTKAVAANGPEISALSTAPFLAQKRLQVSQHLRVVTVGDRAWVAGLDAEHYPLDWRENPAAHMSFLPASAPPEVSADAILLAAELGLGYSSQDWVVCRDGCYVLDVNPAGQWLFLPQEIATEISVAISAWLLIGRK